MSSSEQEQTQHAALSVGQRLGHFRIVSLLGSGGMGEVYRARDLRLNRDVAIKTLPQSLARDPDWLARLEREAQAASALNHPNIVSVYDVGQQDSTTWIVSELVDGQSLRQALSKGPLPLRRVLDLAIQIGDGLAAAHSAGLVHRDLKPENIMLTRDGRVKILDFGLAKHRLNTAAAAAGVGASTNMLTDPLIITGTPAYMSPEQIAGRPLDQRSDLFSLGVVVYEMITGKRPFAGDTSISVMNAVLSEDPQELSTNYPSAIGRVLRHCLEKEPSQRMQSAADFSFAFRLLAQEPQELLAPPSKPNRWVPLLITLTGALVIAAGAFWIGRATTPDDPYLNSRLRRLTWDTGLTTDGAISPNGRLFAYASNRDSQKNLDIYVQAIDNGRPVKLTDDPADDYDPTFSSDNMSVAFRSERGSGGIYVTGVVASGEEYRLIPGGERPRYSPDGKYLLYSHGVNATSWALAAQPLPKGSPVELSKGCQFVSRSAVWAPDSAHVLFQGTCNDQTGLWLGSVDGHPPTPLKSTTAFWKDHKLTSTVGNSAVDDWLINPSRLLIPLHDNDASYELSAPITPDGKLFGPVRRLTFGPARTYRASGAPNGRIVLSIFEQSANLWKLTVNAAGHALGSPSPLTNGTFEIATPYLSRDGKKLTFAARQPGYWVVEAGGLKPNSQRVIARDDTRLTYPLFSPAGDEVIFSSNTGGMTVAANGGLPEAVQYNHATDVSRDGEILAQPDGYRAFNIIQPPGKVTPFLADREGMLFQAHFTTDGQWVTFTQLKDEHSSIFVVPFRKALVPRSEWIQITDDKTWDDKPHFSADNQTVFFTSDRDGFRCIWAQPLTRDKHPRGKPFPVYHIHSSTRAIDDVAGGGLELAVGPNMIVFNQGERTGNIWLLEPR